MSEDLFDFRADAETLAEAEEFVRTYAAVNATEASIWAEIVMVRYDALAAVADAARALYRDGDFFQAWPQLGAALDALDGEQRG